MVQPFYIDTTGASVLGRNQTYGAGSQLQAGARAEQIDTPLMRALSTFGGRIAAQTMQYMFRGDSKALLNYVAFRPEAMKYAVKQALGEQAAKKIVLDPAGGYSPVFYTLAKKYKSTHFIEMDVPKLMSSKIRALTPLGIPANLHLRPVDLQEQHLHEIQPVSVDVMVTMGAYINHADYRSMLSYLQHTLNSQGYIIASFPYREGIENFQENSAVFSRIVTTPKGVVDSEKDIYTIFKGTDFTVTEIIKLSDLAKQQGKAIPADIELLAIAKLGETPLNVEATRQTIENELNSASDNDT